MLTDQKSQVEDNSPDTLVLDSGIEERESTIYLSGPIRKVEDDGREWRNNLIEDYGDEFDFINPLDRYDPEEDDVLSDPIQLDEESEKRQILPSEYVTEDKVGILESQYVFVGLPEVIARGTMMECGFAVEHDKPVFVWTMDGQQESGWLYDHSVYMYNDRNAVMGEIIDYDK